MKSLTPVVPLPRRVEKCHKMLLRPSLNTEAILAGTDHSPFLEKGARGIRFRNQSSQPPSPRRSVTARIRLFNSISLININFSANHSPFKKGARGIFCVILFFLSLLSFSCSSADLNRGRLGFVNFCDLPKHVGDTVWVKATYSGFEEYWGLNGRSCNDLDVDLQYANWSDLNSEIDSLFSKVHDEYYMYKMKLEVRGVFENKMKEYGHLGSNNGLFTVLEFGKVELKRHKLR